MRPNRGLQRHCRGQIGHAVWPLNATVDTLSVPAALGEAAEDDSLAGGFQTLGSANRERLCGGVLQAAGRVNVLD